MDEPRHPDLEGDEETLERLLSHRESLRRLASSLARDSAEADDDLQDAYVRALESPARHGGNTRGWLAKILRNVSFRRSRKASLSRDAELFSGDREVPEPTDDVAAHQEVLTRIAKVVFELPEPYRSVVVLRFYEDEPPRRISQLLDRPLNSVNSQLRRGLAQLRERLEKDVGPMSSLLLLFDRSLESKATVRARATAGHGRRSFVPWAAAVVLVSLGAVLYLRRDAADTRALTSSVESPGSSPREDPLPTPGESAREPLASDLETAPVATTTRARTLEIRVVDSFGSPVHGATVFSHDGPAMFAPLSTWEARGTTGADGSCVLTLDPDREIGSLRLLACAEARVTSEMLSLDLERYAGAPLTLTLGSGSELVVEGVVRDPEGLPVSGALVLTGDAPGAPEELAEGVARSTALDCRHTDADGRFRASGLPRGRQTLRVSKPGYLDHRSVLDAELRTLVQTEVVLRRGGTVSGVVTDETGRPREGVRIWIEELREIEVTRSTATSDERGHYRLTGVEPGPQVVRAKDTSRPEWVARAQIEIEGEYSWNPVLARSAGFRLRLLDESGVPLAGWRARFTSAVQAHRWLVDATTDEEGRAAIFSYPPGAVNVDLYSSREASTVFHAPDWVLHELLPSQEELAVVVPASHAERGRAVGVIGAEGRLAGLQVYFREQRRFVLHRARFDPDTGIFRAEDLPVRTYDLVAHHPERGAYSLGSATVAEGETVDLGVRTPPAVSSLEIDWHWPSSADYRYRVVQFDQIGEMLKIWSLDDGEAPPPSTFELYPGRFMFEVLLDGEIVEQQLATSLPHFVPLTAGPTPRFPCRVHLTVPDGLASKQVTISVLREDGVRIFDRVPLVETEDGRSFANVLNFPEGELAFEARDETDALLASRRVSFSSAMRGGKIELELE